VVVITYLSLSKIKFPAYLLPSDNIWKEDGIVYVDGIVVDDRNMPGTSLGMRRLQTPFRDLLQVRKSVNSFNGIIKNKGNACYIDSNGTCFIYEKTQMCTLKYQKIKKVEKKDIGSIIWVKDVHFAIDIPRPPAPEMEWAGILYFKGLPWKLYDFSETKLKTTKKKI
jgi:hypothetical protein